MKHSFFSIRIDGKQIFQVFKIWSTKPTYWLLLSSAALVFLRALWLFWAFSLTQSLFFSLNLILHIITCFSNSFKSGQSWRFLFSWTISPWMEPAALLSLFCMWFSSLQVFLFVWLYSYGSQRTVDHDLQIFHASCLHRSHYIGNTDIGTTFDIQRNHQSIKLKVILCLLELLGTLIKIQTWETWRRNCFALNSGPL